jgi:hypothetical protein
VAGWLQSSMSTPSLPCSRTDLPPGGGCATSGVHQFIVALPCAPVWAAPELTTPEGLHGKGFGAVRSLRGLLLYTGCQVTRHGSSSCRGGV